MGQDAITLLAVGAFAPHSHAAIEAIAHLCISERNRPTPVRRRLSLTYAGQVKLNSVGVELTSLINTWSQEAFSCPSSLHLYSIHRAKLLHEWAESFSSSSTAGTNEYLDLICRSCSPSGDRSLSCRRYSCFHIQDVLASERGELKTIWFYKNVKPPFVKVE